MKIEERIIARFGVLKANRGTWDAHWQEIAELVFPNHARFSGADSAGTKRTQKMYDSTAVHSSEMLAAGLHGRMTNPAAKWFELKFKNKELNDDRDSSIWLSDSQLIMYEEMQNAKTAFTSHMNEMYLEYCVFGNGILYIAENSKKDSVLYKSISLSNGYIAENSDGVVDTLYRYISMSISQLVGKYGLKNVSEKVQKKYKDGKVDELVNVIHAVEPRSITGHTGHTGNLKFISVTVEEDEKHVLRDSGYDDFPYAAPRYYKAAGEVYARGPAVTALPDIKMLNQMMKTTIAAAEKIVDPALMVPDEGFINPIRTTPGGINYFRPGSKDRIEPLQTGANIPLSLDFMEELRNRIRQVFFNDQMQLGHRPEMTATEVIQRTEDMMRMMGPILGRMQAEALNTIINRTFDILLKQGKFPEPPEQIQGQEIDIVYTSPIAKAQQQLEAGGIARVLESLNIFVSQDPTILQRFDTDEMLDAMVDMFGIRPSFLKPREQYQAEVEQMNEMANDASAIDQLKTGSEAGLNIVKAREISGAG